MNKLILSKLSVIAIAVMTLCSCTDINTDVTGGGDSDAGETPDMQEKPDEQEKPESSNVLVKTKELSGNLIVSAIFSAKALNFSKIFVALPLPLSNQYQDITIVDTDGSEGQTEGGNSILYWSPTYANGDVVDLNCEYEVSYTTYSVNVDFSGIKTIFPYNTESEEYKKYLGNTGEYIVPANPEIESIASSIWAQSTDVLDYAEKCYEYTASNYRYLNPLTGIHTLAENLSNGGGDCGNLTAIYMSLLRNKNIPTRPVVCIRPDATCHVWCEFYLESYGWIPVDVTYKNSDMRGNYFGVYPGDCIVVSNEYDVFMKNGNDEYTLPLLQNFAFWYWNMSDMEYWYYIWNVAL